MGKGLRLISLLLACAMLTSAMFLSANAQSDGGAAFVVEEEEPNVTREGDDPEIERALRAYEADDRLQKTRPVYVPTPEEVAARNVPRREPRAPRERGNALSDLLAGFFKSFGRPIGWLIIIVVAAAILAGLYLMFGRGFSFQRKSKDATLEPEVSTIPDLRPEEAAAKALLKDADALAAEGAYAEAVHLLLFKSIDQIQEKQKGGVPRSLTAREIGGLSGLPDTIRAAFLPIIHIVERSFFGGRPVDEAGWTSARASYQTFAFGEGWS